MVEALLVMAGIVVMIVEIVVGTGSTEVVGADVVAIDVAGAIEVVKATVEVILVIGGAGFAPAPPPAGGAGSGGLIDGRTGGLAGGLGGGFTGGHGESSPSTAASSSPLPQPLITAPLFERLT